MLHSRKTIVVSSDRSIIIALTFFFVLAHSARDLTNVCTLIIELISVASPANLNNFRLQCKRIFKTLPRLKVVFQLPSRILHI